MKIISLLPSATEIVYALGLEDSLMGVTFECDHPPEAAGKPVISSTSLPAADDLSASQIDGLVAEKMAAQEPLYVLDEDRIRSIQPDVILAQDLCHVCAVPSGQVTDALDKLGCSSTVISLDPGGIDDIFESVLEVGGVAGVPDRAAALTDALRERVAAVRRAASAGERVPTLALEWSAPPFIGGHWVPEMVAVAGGADVFGNAGRRSRRVTWEEIAAAVPEAIVFMPCGYGLEKALEEGRSLFESEALSSTPAAREGRVFAVDASSYFSRPGPRIVDGIEILGWILHPEACPEPPPGRVGRVSRSLV